MLGGSYDDMQSAQVFGEHSAYQSVMQYAYAQRMDANEKKESLRHRTRRNRLELLVSEVGNAAQLARETGTPPTHISAMRKVGGRGLGDELAAKFEKTYDKPAGWFDIPMPDVDEAEIVDLSSNALLQEIRSVKLKLTAGISGYAIESLEQSGLPIFFRKDWMEARGYKAKNLIAIKVTGHSMEPSLHANDMVVINVADTEPADGKAFAVNYEGEPVVKRLVRDGGIWWLSSDNPDQRRFPRKECTAETAIIIGRVVHKQSEDI